MTTPSYGAPIPPEGIPTDYREGYVRARVMDPSLADSYVAHTIIGDPKGDELIDHLADMEPPKRQALYRGLMDRDPEVERTAPALARDLFEEAAQPPEWYDPHATMPGTRAFFRDADAILQAFAAGVIVEGFASNISKSFVITGRLRDQGLNRLQMNNRHVLDIFLPGGLERLGDGWKLSLRIRLVHAQVRRLLLRSQEWDAAAWGTPISAAHLGLGAASFSARLILHSTRLGVNMTREERESFMMIWRYSYHLMGIPESMQPKTEQEALHFFDVAAACEPPPDMESVVASHALVKAIPVLLGLTEEKETNRTTQEAYTISRALIGHRLADALRYPRFRTTGVLQTKRLKRRFRNTVGRALPPLFRSTKLDNLSGVMAISLYEDSGISYAMPNYLGRNVKWGDLPPEQGARQIADASHTERANRLE